MIMVRCCNMKADFCKRIKSLNAQLVEIFLCFKTYFVNAWLKRYIFIQQVRDTSVFIRNSDSNFMPFLIMLFVQSNPNTLCRPSFCRVQYMRSKLAHGLIPEQELIFLLFKYKLKICILSV